LQHTDEDFELISATNFRSSVWTMQAAIPMMQKQGGGSIVNIASVSVLKPELNSYFYGAFKAALNNLSVNVAKEFAPDNIRVNVVCPGPVITSMTPKAVQNQEGHDWLVDTFAIIGRVGQPDDVANVVLFLASDEASWITGSSYLVDGGTYIS
jgi:NAD(P)-dependent dehydrogenase (short-subunit alcohol dehydrogenase family)